MGEPAVRRPDGPDQAPTTNVAPCNPATAHPATAEPPEAAVDGTDTSTWLAEQPGTALTVDLLRTIALRDITVTRPPVLVSADGHTWTTLASVTAPTLRDFVSGSGQRIRFVRRLVSRADSTAQHPLVVGELAVRAG